MLLAVNGKSIEGWELRDVIEVNQSLPLPPEPKLTPESARTHFRVILAMHRHETIMGFAAAKMWAEVIWVKSPSSLAMV